MAMKNQPARVHDRLKGQYGLMALVVTAASGGMECGAKVEAITQRLKKKNCSLRKLTSSAELDHAIFNILYYRVRIAALSARRKIQS